MTAVIHSERPPIIPTRDILLELAPLVAAAERIELLASHLDDDNAEVSIGAIAAEADRMREAMKAYNGKCGLSLCELSLLGVPMRRTRDVNYLVLTAVAVHLGVADKHGAADQSDLLKLVASALGITDHSSVYETFLRYFRNGYQKPLSTLTVLAERTRLIAADSINGFLANYDAPRREDYGL